MSQIATDAIQDTIRKTGNTHPAQRRSDADPCPQCAHCATDNKGGWWYDTTCRECCHSYSSQFERRST